MYVPKKIEQKFVSAFDHSAMVHNLRFNGATKKSRNIKSPNKKVLKLSKIGLKVADSPLQK